MQGMQSKAARRHREAYGEEAPVSAFDAGPIKTRLEKVDWGIIITLSVLAGILRFYALGYSSLWFDELWTWRVSHSGFEGLFQGLTDDIHLPNFFLIEVVLIKLFGDSEFVLRFPAAIFGILSVGAIYVFGRRLFGRNVGLMSAILVAFGERTFYYSQEARPYSMMLFLGIVTSYLWFKLYERLMVEDAPPGKLPIGLFVMLAISCFTHYFCVLLTLFQITIFAYLAFRRKRGRKILMYFCAGLVVLAAMWVPVLQLQLQNLFSWTELATFSDALRDMLVFTFGGTYMSHKAGFAFGIVLAVCCFGFLLRDENEVLRKESKSEFELNLVLVLLWAVPFLFSQIVSMTITPIFVDRYLLFTLPFAFIALSFQLSRLKIPKLGHIALVLCLVALPAYFDEKIIHWFTEPNRSSLGDWRQVITETKLGIPSDGKTVALAVTERAGVAQYYFGKLIPGVEIAGMADTRKAVPQAIQAVVKENPDHILLFYGEASQSEQRETVVRVGGILQHMFGKPRMISYKQGRPIGSMIFDVHH
jgi:uncharacterized membrane protein